MSKVSTVDTDAARELVLYATNTGSLWGPGNTQGAAIRKNLELKAKKGTLDPSKAPKLFEYFMESAAKEYVREMGSPGDRWSDIFNKSTRRLAAEELSAEYLEEELGLQPNVRSKAEFGFVHDASTGDFLRPATREDMLRSLKSESGEYRDGGRRLLVRNGSKMKYYDKTKKLGITDNMNGDLVTWGEGSYDARDELKDAGFIYTKFGFWVGPKATKKNFSAALETVFGVVRNGQKVHRVPVPPKNPVHIPAARPRRGEEKRSLRDIIHEAERDKYPFDFAIRNGSEQDTDFLNDRIAWGIILGFWLPAWASAMDEVGLSTPRIINEDTAPRPPEAVEDFAIKFGARVSTLNKKELYQMAELLGVDLNDVDELEEFGYNMAMEAQGTGVGWGDDHENNIGADFIIPTVEFGVDLQDPEDEDSGEVIHAEMS